MYTYSKIGESVQSPAHIGVLGNTIVEIKQIQYTYSIYLQRNNNHRRAQPPVSGAARD